MAKSYTCDGCGVNVDQPKVVGHVIRREYCEQCAKNAESFLAAEEDHRAHYCRRFEEIRQQLINVHGNGGTFKLPDVA